MDYSTTPISRCRRDIFQWIEQPAMKRAPVYPPSTMTAVDYMPLYPQLDISSYSTVSSNFPSPPSETFLVSQRRTPVQDTSALVHTSEDVNESLWWGTPIPTSPGGPWVSPGVGQERGPAPRSCTEV